MCVPFFAVCSACPYGKYVSAACEGARDTLCADCSVCSSGELLFEAAECAQGKDAICSSCRVCSFLHREQALRCRGPAYAAWRAAECCKGLAETEVSVWQNILIFLPELSLLVCVFLIATVTVVYFGIACDSLKEDAV